ncbi:hypothetical protein B0T14DRAFT_56401 [Immersiella caudata]|uniref:Uncharacterized protein n=1 Tax=Immersiella caudata TaxID=314043 RepID=A0AA39XFR0_9PEZI|nr:hypothetical protein B0T14DRAFT_56401 [Immersiella caudata]
MIPLFPTLAISWHHCWCADSFTSGVPLRPCRRRPVKSAPKRPDGGGTICQRFSVPRPTAITRSYDESPPQRGADRILTHRRTEEGLHVSTQMRPPSSLSAANSTQAHPGEGGNQASSARGLPACLSALTRNGKSGTKKEEQRRDRCRVTGKTAG